MSSPKNPSKSDTAPLSKYGNLFAGLLALPYGCWLAILVGPVIFIESLGFWGLFFTGRFPKGFYNFGVRYFTKLHTYSLRLTNEYPPFSGNRINTEDAEHPSNGDQN